MLKSKRGPGTDGEQTVAPRNEGSGGAKALNSLIASKECWAGVGWKRVQTHAVAGQSAAGACNVRGLLNRRRAAHRRRSVLPRSVPAR